MDGRAGNRLYGAVLRGEPASKDLMPDAAQSSGELVSAYRDSGSRMLAAFRQPGLAEVPPDRSPFAAPQPVADDAPAIDRLAACLGRPVRPSTPQV